jgi:hypothetical protein
MKRNMMSSTHQLLAAIALVLFMLISINLRVLSMHKVYDLQARLGDSILENFKVLPANRLVHVSRFGLGHRLLRDASAYHLAKSLDLARLKIQWGSCSIDTNWKGKEHHDEYSIFPYLFGNDLWNVPTLGNPAREGKKIVARNDIYGYVEGEIYKKYALPIYKDEYKSDEGPFMSKLASDSEFFEKMVDSYVFSDKVEAFMQEHDFANHEVIGIHLLAGNGEKKRTIEDERQFMNNLLFLVQQYVRLMKMLYHERFAARTPLIFLATDTPRLIPEFIEATEAFGVKTVHLEQIRLEDDEGVTFRALAGKGDKCLEGWQGVMTDMILLSNSDVVVAARPSAITQSLPLARVFDRHDGEEGPHFCEVSSDGNAMSCFEDKETWLFRDDIRKIVPISRGRGLNGLFDETAEQVTHKLLVGLPDLEKPPEFAQTKFILDNPNRSGKDIVKYIYGEKAIWNKYPEQEGKYEPIFSFAKES